MSTRWYPLYKAGNPQLRVYLPNFWMKVVKPDEYMKVPPNIVHFQCSMEMTKLDIKNYLEKIYGISATSVKTRIVMGPVKEAFNGQLYKEGDVKMAYITLPLNETFTYPDLFAKKQKSDVRTERKEQMDKTFQERQKGLLPHAMPWFQR